MNRNKARDIILDLTERLSPFCVKMEPVGSWRRNKTELHDLDFIILESNTRKIFGKKEDQLTDKIEGLGKVLVSGAKNIRIIYQGEQIDFYLTDKTKNYCTLKLIRTGSADFNKKLCVLAKRKGMTLKANGDGLIYEDTGKQVTWGEDPILEKLMGYVPPPEERE